MPIKADAMSECNRCGECCRWIGLPYPYLRQNVEDDADFDRWLDLHGIRRYHDAAGQEWIAIPLRCRALLPDNTCNIYADRPVLCQEWRPEDAADAERWGHCSLGPPEGVDDVADPARA